jgi:hypothetical protein
MMSHIGQKGVYFKARNNNNRLLGTLFMGWGDTPKPTVILLHGMPGIEKNYDLALMFRRRDWNCLLFHYQGCWGSDGLYTLKTLPQDVLAAVDFLTAGNQPYIDTQHLFVAGHSMGGWAAMLAAIEDERIKAVAALGAICHPAELQWTLAEIEEMYTPWLPGLSSEAFAEQWAALDDIWSPSQRIQELKQPLLILHGAQDEVVPVKQAIKLAQNAHPKGQLILHPQANHAFTWHRDWLGKTLWSWMQSQVESK